MASSVTGLYGSQRVSPWWPWLETLVFTGLCFALGAWNQPDDPFYTDGSFAWPVLAPLLVGLRYGFFLALVSSLLLIGGLFIYLRMEPAAIRTFPLAWAVGVLAIGMLAGEFRDYWDRRCQRLQATNHYRQHRLEEFTRNYYLLKISHDRLEQQLAGSSSSLREALLRLRADIGYLPGRGLDRNTANAMLQLLVRYGQIQTAGLFPIAVGKLVHYEPLASIGEFTGFSPDDPLIRHSLAERKLISIQTEYRQRQSEMETDLLAAIPFIDSSGELIALCAIEAMPFFSFAPRTLRFMSILAGHMADMITDQGHAPGGDNDPEHQALWRHLRRVGVDAEEYGLTSSLLVLTMTADRRAQQITDHMHRIRRGLDVIAEFPSGTPHGDTRQTVVVLMPLIDELGLAGYQQRLDDDVREHLGIPLGEWQMQCQTLQIRQRDASERWLRKQLDHVH